MDPRDQKPLDEEIDVFGLTDAGKVRQENQDHFLISSLHKEFRVHGTSLPDLQRLPLEPERLAFLAMVADGVAGSASGRAASKTALETVVSYVAHSMRCYYTHDPDDEEEFLAALQTAVHESHSAVLARAEGHPARHGMATTLTIMISVWPRAYIVQVGDSRCYQLRDGELRQITKDQTVAQELIDEGKLTAEEAEGTRLAHILSSAIGGPAATPVITKVDLHFDDVLLLCSDGLTKHVSDDEIREHLMTIDSAEEVCRTLLADALEGGGRDNITVIVGRLTAAARAKREQELGGGGLTAAIDEAYPGHVIH